MSIQTYQDITFVLGPPSGDRYEMIKSAALETGDTFSKLYRGYMDDIISDLDECGFFDKIFSTLLDEEIRVNRVYPTYQMWGKRNPKFAKFYLRPSEENAELPALMVFPPQFTTKCGLPIESCVERDDAKVVSAILGKSLELDWVNLISVYNTAP